MDRVVDVYKQRDRMTDATATCVDFVWDPEIYFILLLNGVGRANFVAEKLSLKQVHQMVNAVIP